MEELLKEFIETIKKDKTQLRALKMLVVDNQQYELGASLRELELECFPETKEVAKNKLKTRQLVNALAMCELRAGEKECYIFSKVYEEIRDKDMLYSLKDASKIIDKANEIYG